MSKSRTLSISTKHGEAAVLSYTAEQAQQDGGIITLFDQNGEPAVEIRFLEGATYRDLGSRTQRIKEV